MKNTLKLFGNLNRAHSANVPRLIIAMVAITGFTMAACDNSGDGGINNEKDCTVSFLLGYDTVQSPPQPITVKAGQSAGSAFPQNPIRPIWDFTGWKNEAGTIFTSNTVITNDVTLTASWNFTPGTSNPIIRDRFTADPAALVDGDTVYIFVGHDQLPPSAPSTEYFRMPEWLLYSSRDMKTFKYEGTILKPEDFSFGVVNSAWASQAIKGLDGKYYFYVTVNGGQGQVVGVAVADQITGPYAPVQTPVVTRSMVNADTGINTDDNIDPTVFIDDDGSAYLMWGQNPPRMAKLKSNMTEIERPVKRATQDGWRSQDVYVEGAFLYKRGNFYYMMYASGWPNNAETISYAMADTINGPWTNGVRLTGNAPSAGGGYSYTIHPAAIDFKGQSYLFYHNAMLTLPIDGVTWIGGGGRRSIAVDYLQYNEDGTIKLFEVTNEGLSVPPSIKNGEEPDDRENVTISFVLNYTASVEPPASVTIKKGGPITISNLPRISRPEPWMFLGWFTAPSGGEPVDENAAFQSDTNLYAHWAEKSWFELNVTLYNTTQSSTFRAPPICNIESDNSLTAEFTGEDSQALTIRLSDAQRAILAGLPSTQTIQIVIDGTAIPDDTGFRYFIGSSTAASSWNGTTATSYMPGRLSSLLCQTLNFSSTKDAERLGSFILQVRGGSNDATTVNIKSIRILY
jgi:hypothetical protein